MTASASSTVVAACRRIFVRAIIIFTPVSTLGRTLDSVSFPIASICCSSMPVTAETSGLASGASEVVIGIVAICLYPSMIPLAKAALASVTPFTMVCVSSSMLSAVALAEFMTISAIASGSMSSPSIPSMSMLTTKASARRSSSMVIISSKSSSSSFSFSSKVLPENTS